MSANERVYAKDNEPFCWARFSFSCLLLFSYDNLFSLACRAIRRCRCRHCCYSSSSSSSSPLYYYYYYRCSSSSLVVVIVIVVILVSVSVSVLIMCFSNGINGDSSRRYSPVIRQMLSQ